MADYKRPLPQPTPETQHFWDGCRDGEIRLQRCKTCNHTYFPPRDFCPACSAREVEVVKASGKATLYSYVINHRPRPDFGEEPHSIAVVQLEEGPRMMTNIVGCTPDAVYGGMPVEVCFQEHSGENAGNVSLPQFTPDTG